MLRNVLRHVKESYPPQAYILLNQGGWKQPGAAVHHQLLSSDRQATKIFAQPRSRGKGRINKISHQHDTNGTGRYGSRIKVETRRVGESHGMARRGGLGGR